MEYSINKGLWGTSVGGKETLHSDQTLPEEAYPSQVTTTKEETLTIDFEKGEICGVNGVGYSNKIDAIRAVEAIGSKFGIGRDMHVGDTIIGIKGRVGFEAAGPMLIINAHKMLEKHTLEAVFSFPPDMFHPGANTNACCMVFNLGTRHENAQIKETFFGYFKNDGFSKKKNLGRIEDVDENGKGVWEKVEREWLDLYSNRITKKGISVTKKVSAKDEWLAEAYMETDYNSLNQDDFQKVLNQYLGYLISSGGLLK